MRLPTRFLAAAALFRLSCLIPQIIDDDEAWWAASAHALATPWRFYQRAVDPKPPGVVWLYWLCDRLAPSGLADPRVTRSLYVLICFGGAWLLGILANRAPGARRDGDSGRIAAAFFLLASAAPSVKLFSVTAEGLLAVMATAIFALAFVCESVAAAFLCGILLGLALLVKQTAIFFVIPLVLEKRPWSRIGSIGAGAALVLLPAIAALGPRDFFYWNWSYPFHSLISTRREVFATGSDFLENILLFVFFTAPLVWASIAWIRRRGLASLRDYRVLWLLSGIAAVALGRGLFLHYFLLCVPPLCLLATEELAGEPAPRKVKLGRRLAWLAIPYFAGCAVLMIPCSGVFWGLDMPYFQSLSRTIRESLRQGRQVLIWGGSAIPLVDDGHPYATRFVLPRFAEPPYSDRDTGDIFHRELLSNPPTLVVDLHQRGDNRFSNPVQSDPTLAAMLRAHYELYVLPALPWARFYFREPPRPQAGLVKVPASRLEKLAGPTFPTENEPWLGLLEPFRPLSWKGALRKVLALDQKLRAQSSLELLELQSMDPRIENQARSFRLRLNEEPWSPRLKKELEPFLSTTPPPFPWRSFLWWPELALVQLQPRASQLKTP